MPHEHIHTYISSNAFGSWGWRHCQPNQHTTQHRQTHTMEPSRDPCHATNELMNLLKLLLLYAVKLSICSRGLRGEEVGVKWEVRRTRWLKWVSFNTGLKVHLRSDPNTGVQRWVSGHWRENVSHRETGKSKENKRGGVKKGLDITRV